MTGSVSRKTLLYHDSNAFTQSDPLSPILFSINISFVLLNRYHTVNSDTTDSPLTRCHHRQWCDVLLCCIRVVVWMHRGMAGAIEEIHLEPTD